ncbi:hypothetical protein [Cellulosilyticum ruminicola]|uniref:hypothetical protein n=1 Tax=Cellulosilyticum ruminicola TaxID=425254 RepID=UPI0006D10B86|nr:hypothetical protein [Cellulosilyticum ruminicola]
MPKMTIPIAEARPGMITAKAIRNSNSGIVYIGEEQELTKEVIERLRELQFEEIEISVNSWDTVWKISKETREQYEFCTEAAKLLFQKVADDNVIDFEAFKTIKRHVKDNFKDNFKL